MEVSIYFALGFTAGVGSTLTIFWLVPILPLLLFLRGASTNSMRR